MAKHVAVVGSRGIARLPWKVEVFLADMFRRDCRFVVVSGGAQGIDTVAARWAKEHYLYVKVFVPDWDAHGKSAGVLRNQQIVDVADTVIAVWDGKSRGTKDTITRALKARKELHVFYLEEGERR